MLELGTDGRLLALQLDELVAGVDTNASSSSATTSRPGAARRSAEACSARSTP